MNIFITMAGKSKRFKEKGYNLPKFLLDVGGKSVISRVIDCFSENDTFHFIISKSQNKNFKNIYKTLTELCKNFKIHIIDDHDAGPVHSVMSIINEVPEEPFIITYCDFLIQWNYSSFKRLLSDCDAVVPTFTGFHPASFGNTLFAYIKVDTKNNLLELKEKESFTNDRLSELASTGTYYFQDKNKFIKYANEILHDPLRTLPEAYVSLLVNPMVRDGLIVKTYNVNKFICLGTPFDYEQYVYWFNSLKPENAILKKNITNPRISEDINIMPVAGEGSRFVKAGFKTPKPLLLFDKHLLIEHSFFCMPKSKKNIIISRLNKFYEKKIFEKLKNNLEELKVINLSYCTKGQLNSCLAANKSLNKSDSVLISSCDYSLHYDESSWFKCRENKEVDVYIWTNKLKSTPIKSYDAFAYCEIDDNNNVKKIIEKNTLSKTPWLDPMVVGTFWFKNWNNFLEMNDAVIKRGSFNNTKENYIATNINYLIRQGLKVKCFWVDRWISYGDPFEYEMIHYWSEYFRDTKVYEK